MLRSLRRLALPLVALALAACGSDGPTVAELPDGFVPHASLNVDLAQFTRTPSGLYIQQLQSNGAGAPIAPGQAVAVAYVGRLGDTGAQFDASAPGDPIEFVLGRGRVIRGWDEGIAGMRIGDRRRLVIPPALGYGARPNGPIPANSVLVFDVERVERLP